MNFLHYLYTKGVTVSDYRLDGRSFIVFPIFCFTLFWGLPLLPNGVNEFFIILIFLCWLCTLYGLTYIVIPKKKVRLKTWLCKYKNMTSLWAYMYFFSPIITFWIYSIIEFP